MRFILHICEREAWAQAEKGACYSPRSRQTEGLIHGSRPDQIVRVANALFRGQTGLVVLCIDPVRLQAEVRHEGYGGGDVFPHIYGPLNPDAVTKVADFTARQDGSFDLPSGLVQAEDSE
jgi:uncharacterized protein (DUF952 family)